MKAHGAKREAGARGFRAAIWLTVLLAACGIVGCAHESHPFARILALSGPVAPPQGAAEFLGRFTVSTRFEGKVSINAIPATKVGLAVFFLSSKSDWKRLAKFDGRLINLRGNCSALPGESTIACDSDFLEDFLPKHLEYPANDTRRSAFLRWALGHELGHVMEGQLGGHFAGPVAMRRTLRNLDSQRQEYAADCWMFLQLNAKFEPNRVTEVEGLAIDLINSRLLEKEGTPPAGVGILYDYNRLDPYDFLADDNHPDFLLRSARLLHIAARSDSALSSMVSRFVQRLTPDPLWKERGPCGPEFSAAAIR